MNRISLNIYRLWVIALANLFGGGLHDAILTSKGWYTDPIGWVRSYHEPATAVHPFYYTAAFLVIATLIALAATFRYRGPAHRTVLVTLLTTLFILALTYMSFIPASRAVRADPAILPDAEIISLSRTWVICNIARQVAYGIILYQAIVALGRIGRADISAEKG